MKLLDPPTLRQITHTSMECGLADDATRELLVGDLPHPVASQLPRRNNPADQLRSDLQALNRITRLDDVPEPPLVLWLHRAVERTRLDPRAEPLRGALRQLKSEPDWPPAHATAKREGQRSLTMVAASGAALVALLLGFWLSPGARAIHAPDVGLLAFLPPDAAGSGPAPDERDTSPLDFVPLPAGAFTLGCAPPREKQVCFPDERATAAQLAPYALSRYEVTAAEYGKCVDDGGCDPGGTGSGCTGAERNQRPINCVTWSQARRYCQWLGARLPTEAEWEAAARTADGRDYPWGSHRPARCEELITAECRQEQTPPLTDQRGAYDAIGPVRGLGGGVREWVDYQPSVYSFDNLPDEHAINRGGSAVMTRDDLGNASAHTRHEDLQTAQRPDLGFRCARDRPEAR